MMLEDMTDEEKEIYKNQLHMHNVRYSRNTMIINIITLCILLIVLCIKLFKLL
jgi:hypothetical protein